MCSVITRTFNVCMEVQKPVVVEHVSEGVMGCFHVIRGELDANLITLLLLESIHYERLFAIQSQNTIYSVAKTRI